MTRIMGIDLSITATGVCMPSGATVTVSGRAGLGDRRLPLVRDHIRESLRLQPADLVVIEDLPTHAKAAGITGMVHGAVRTLLMDLCVPYVLVTPATLKAYATGKGNCDKAAMILAAYKRGGREFSDDNQCDAFWLRAAGTDHYGEPLFPLPQAQRDRLAKVAWPVVRGR